MTILICDHPRLRDLERMDTVAENMTEAKRLAEEMARKYGVRVYVLAVVGEVEGQVETRWTRDPAPPDQQSQGAPAIAGWWGMTVP